MPRCTPETREPREISVAGVKLALMFDGQCRQVRVGRQISSHAGGLEEMLEDRDKELSRLRVVRAS